jgi:hypothetical protein
LFTAGNGHHRAVDTVPAGHPLSLPHPFPTVHCETDAQDQKIPLRHRFAKETLAFLIFTPAILQQIKT